MEPGKTEPGKMGPEKRRPLRLGAAAQNQAAEGELPAEPAIKTTAVHHWVSPAVAAAHHHSYARSGCAPESRHPHPIAVITRNPCIPWSRARRNISHRSAHVNSHADPGCLSLGRAQSQGSQCQRRSKHPFLHAAHISPFHPAPPPLGTVPAFSRPEAWFLLPPRPAGYVLIEQKSCAKVAPRARK